MELGGCDHRILSLAGLWLFGLHLALLPAAALRCAVASSPLGAAAPRRWGCGGLRRPLRRPVAVATIMGGAGPQWLAADSRVVARPAGAASHSRPARKSGSPQWVVEWPNGTAARAGTEATIEKRPPWPLAASGLPAARRGRGRAREAGRGRGPECGH